MMDGNKLEELRELVEFLKANGIAEFDMEQEDLKVRIKFAGEPVTAPAGGFDMAQLSRLMASAPAAASASAASARASAAAELADELAEKLHEVKSPIVGTFYESPMSRRRRVRLRL